jgi:hypothetical protein
MGPGKGERERFPSGGLGAGNRGLTGDGTVEKLAGIIMVKRAESGFNVRLRYDCQKSAGLTTLKQARAYLEILWPPGRAGMWSARAPTTAREGACAPRERNPAPHYFWKWRKTRAPENK